MTRDELGAILRGLVPVMRESLAASLDGLSARLKAVEDRPAVMGPIGPIGQRGPQGEPGAEGIGQVGPQGERGADGLVGPAGPAGADGVDGKDGPAGVAGRDGRDGAAGLKGADGLHGRDGAPGRDGVDGLGFDDMDEVLEDGGRIVVRRYTCGDRVKEFRHQTAQTIYRGVFVEGQTYEHGDMVTWGGSTWHAKATTTIKPDETIAAAKFWQLAVKRGREGKTGRDGKGGSSGPKGDKGDPGPRWS